MVAADVKKINQTDYKIPSYPPNPRKTYYIRKISDIEIVWSNNDKFKKLDFTVKVEDRKVVIYNSGSFFFSYYKSAIPYFGNSV